jgi:hypothetical protein
MAGYARRVRVRKSLLAASTGAATRSKRRATLKHPPEAENQSGFHAALALSPRSHSVAQLKRLRSAGDVLALQRTIGNRATNRLLRERNAGLRHLTSVGSGALQRRLTITNIDYDPVAQQYRHGIINQTDFFAALTTLINGAPRYAIFRNQWNNVLARVRAAVDADENVGMAAPDVPRLATAVANEVVNAYMDLNLAAITAQRANLVADITPLLAANIQNDPGQGAAMTQQESGAFDQLARIVGDERMSRAKGTASPLPYDSLPQAVKPGVDVVLGDIRTERALWRNIGVANLDIAYFLPQPHKRFSMEVLERQRAKRYQGNHTNNAGWLPAAAAPPSQLAVQRGNIWTGASQALKQELKRDTPLETLGIVAGAPNNLGQQFIRLVATARQAMTDAQLADSVGSVLTQGVSAYIEFSLPGQISRLVYDVNSGRVYISAHYKWRQGYNPWFEVTGHPGV